MRKRLLRRGLLIAAVHAFVCLALTALLALSLSTAEDPDLKGLSRVLLFVSIIGLYVVGGPFVWFWAAAGRRLPTAVGLPLFLANSALWGFAAAFVWELISGACSVIRRARSDDPPPAPGTLAHRLRVPVAWVVFTWQVAWKRLRIWIPRLLAALVALAILGYASNLVSKGACRRRTEQWIARDVMAGSRFPAVSVDSLPWVTVAPVRWRCPFVVEVRYTCVQTPTWGETGWRRYVCFFGITIYAGERVVASARER